MPIVKSDLQVIPTLDSMEFLRARLTSHRFPVHFHDTFVIQLIQSGADWCCVNDLIASSGQVFVHFPMATHTGGTRSNGHLDYQAIYPSIDLFSKVTGLSRSKIPAAESCASSSPALVSKLHFLLQQLNATTGERELRKPLAELFLEVLQQCQEVRGQSSSLTDLQQRLEAAREYLETHCERDVSIGELSSYCGVSLFHLIRSFKIRYGITPRRFLISQRVSLAKQLMITGVPLAETAFASGFADQSHLARCFKRVTTCSPGQFKSAASIQANQH